MLKFRIGKGSRSSYAEKLIHPFVTNWLSEWVSEGQAGLQRSCAPNYHVTPIIYKKKSYEDNVVQGYKNGTFFCQTTNPNPI